MPATINTETLSLAAFARLLKVSAPMVSKHKTAGRLVLDAKGRVMVAESIKRIAATADPSHARKTQGALTSQAAGAEKAAGESPEQAPAERNYLNARAKSEHFKAESAELEYRKAAGELMVAAEVVAALSDAATALRNRLESLPDTLAPQLAAEKDEQQIRALLAEYVEHTLSDLAHGFEGMVRA